MILWGIFITSFVVGFSGAMMPGPMLGVTIDGSMKKGFFAGPLVVVGYAVLELLLVIIMILGLKDFFTNPYFILWWATTGIGFIRQSYAVGFLGIFLFFIGHILSDFTWFSVVSVAFSKGKKVLSDNIYRTWIIMTCPQNNLLC